MCTLAKLFSISIIIIENNFANVHMSFLGSFRSHNPTWTILVGMYGVQYNLSRTILVGMYGVQYSARTEYSEYSTYSAETHVYTGEIVFCFHYHHCFLKNLETHVYTGKIVFYFHYHHRKQFRRFTHEFPDSFRSHNPTRTILVGMYGVQYSAHTEYSEYSRYSARTYSTPTR